MLNNIGTRMAVLQSFKLLVDQTKHMINLIVEKFLQFISEYG